VRPRARYVESGYLALHPKAWGGEFLIFGGGETPKAFELEGASAVVTIAGPLTQHSVFIWDSYDAIRERCKAAFASEAARVILRIDSPGGDAAGCFDLARELRAMSASAGKPLCAFTDAMAASAAYAIACSAQRICVTSTALAGSIGVYEVLVDATAQDRAMGLNVVVVASGERKTDSNPHVPITKGAVEELKTKVDGLASLFFELVGEMRGIDPGAVRALEGALPFGAEAVRAGLADEVLTWAEFLSSLETAQPGAPAAQTASENGNMSKYLDEAKVALRRAAEDEKDEETKKKAEKALKALDDGDGDEEKKKEEAAAKAKAEEDEKKKKDEADAKAKAEKDEADAKAKAMAGNALALAEEVARLKAKDASRDAAEAKAKEDGARASLLAKRPDFSVEQRATLALVPLEEVAKAVEKWPRVNAAPGASVNASLPGNVAGGERTDTYAPKLTQEEQEMFEKTGGARAASAKRPAQVGTAFQMPRMTQAEAAKLAADLEKGT
jgi:ClpP class serine protease